MNSDAQPLVSICIPCYKYPELIKRCLISVLSQTYTNFEVIVTDDSQDDVISDLIKTEFTDSRIFYQRNAVRLGSPANWNESTRLAKGEYIKIMNHDDWFAGPDSLEKFVHTAIAENADFVYSNCVDHFPEKTRNHKISKRLSHNLILKPYNVIFVNFVGAPSVIFYKRPSGANPQFDIKTLWFVDVLFYFEFIISGKKVVHINEYLLNITAGSETQITNSAIDISVVIGEFDYVCRKHNLYEKHDFLVRLYLVEILKRYNVKSKEEFENTLGRPFEKMLPYFLLKWPIHHQIYNVFKHFLMRV